MPTKLFLASRRKAKGNEMTKHNISINGKDYKVTKHEDGYTEIVTTWESIVPSTAQSVFPQYCHRFASISPFGRLGKKVLAQINAQ
jgi:hypothetical protein